MATSYGLVRSVAPVPSACPEASSGHSYLALLNDSVGDVLYAFQYLDGTYVSTIASWNYGALFNLPNINGIAAVGLDKVIFTAHRPLAGTFRQLIVTWKPSTGEHWIAETDEPPGEAFTYDPVPISGTQALVAVETELNALEWYVFTVATNIAPGAWGGNLVGETPFDVNQGFGAYTYVTGAGPTALHQGFDFSQSPSGHLFGLGQDDVPALTDDFVGGLFGGQRVAGGALVATDYEPDASQIGGVGVLSGSGAHTRWTPDSWSATIRTHVTCIAPTPSGAEWVAVLNTEELLRAPLGAISAECPPVTVAIESAPVGAVFLTPFHFFALD
jgi:hypothetical protein